MRTSPIQPSGTATEPAPADAPGSEAATARRVGYEPGLDGLRAVALLSIYVVHANVGLAPGGFLAVSTFFTLSGFLITALLASEHRSRGRIDLRSFWARRARRLLPASLVTIAAIAAATIALGDPIQVANLRGDVIGSLAYVANWRFLFAGTTYAGEFAGQSPLLHFWSLAIEEQFYVIFPLIAVGAFAAGRRWRHGAATVLGIGVAASLVAGIVGAAGAATPDRLYFRTDIRAGELLVGALFGLWWVNGYRRLPEAVHRIIRGAGGILLVAMVALIATSNYEDAFWYQGGLLAYSLVTVGVILAAVEPSGPVRSLLSLRPLVAVGVVSYGAYLVHWPLFMWLFTETSVSGPVRLVGGTIVSLVLAALSHRLLELPIREKRVFPLRPLLAAGVALAAVAVVIGVVAPRLAVDDEVPLDLAAEAIEDSLTFTAAAPGEAPTVGLFGDSTALITTLGLTVFDDTDTTIRTGSGWAGLGCTINAPAEFLSNGRVVESNEICADWLEQWRVAAEFGDLDLALVQFGPWEVKEMRPAGVDDFQTIGEPAQDALVEQRLVEGVEALLAEIPVVAIATSPYVEPGRVNGRPPAQPQPDADPARMDRLNEIIVEVASRYPNVAVIDLAGWLAASDDDARIRPDGVHFTDQTALELSPRFANTLVEVLAVADGAEPSTDGAERFPVLRHATR